MDGLNIPLDAAEGRLGGLRETPQRWRRKSRYQRLRKYLGVFAFVLLPTMLSSGYYIGIASYQYVSEARFVVRSPAQDQPGIISGLLGGASSAEADTFSVRDYILSRDALAQLVKDDDIRAIFSRPEADILSKYPRPYTADNFEFLYRYYLDHVDVDYNSTTGVSVLTVKAFRSADAQRVAQDLLSASERLVNQMNDRARENALRASQHDVMLAEQNARDVAAKIAAFRNREALLDPTKQSTAILQGVSELQMKLAQTRTQLSELGQSSPDSPLIASGRRRVTALQAQIDDQLGKVAGSNHSMVPKITEYDDLVLQREFAERALASATTSLERARVDAERQQLYLNTVVLPNEADYPAFPKRLSSIAIVFATCLGGYTLARLLIAAAREHQAH